MLPKFTAIKTEFEEIQRQLHDTSLVMDHQKLKGLNKRYTELQPAMEFIQELVAVESAQKEAEKTLAESQDEEFRSLAMEEQTKLAAKHTELSTALSLLTTE